MMKSLKQFLTAMKSGFAVPVYLLAILAMIALPLPPFLLDLFFTFNIVLSVLILLAAVSSKRPLEFSIFPTVLLLATLLRLCMNVASTRVVLQHGHEGAGAAGKVIEAFGNVVIGGNYVVGSVVFVILTIVNFMVITKGSERISEVGARFTLDAMPGKQMAIDADLNAGMIDQEQARQRRKEIGLEADFYGSMDGASKFVKGDAIAGILILMINLLGGTAIGVFQHDLSVVQSLSTYGLLSIGDGLVAQIPSLMIAVAAGIIVTRVSDTDEEVSSLVQSQMLASPKLIATVAIIMLIMGLVPGMPTIAFGSFGLVMGYAAWRQSQAQTVGKGGVRKRTPEMEAKLQEFVKPVEQPLQWSEIPYTDQLKLELGYQLVYLVDRDKGAELLQRIRGVRQTLSEQAGFLLPEVRVRDNMGLKPNQYAIYLNNVRIALSDIVPDRLMAINTGELLGEINGILAKEPVYGMDAVWITQADKARALNLGYSVVDSATIIGTHMSKVIRDNLSELLQHDDVQHLMNRLSQLAPKLTEELTGKVPFNLQLKVYRHLLNDQVSLVDVRTIGQSLLDAGEFTKDPILLAAEARAAMRSTILYSLIGNNTNVQVFTLGNEMEQALLNAVTQSQRSGNGTPLDSIPVDPQLLGQLQSKMPTIREQMQLQGHAPILLVLPQLRPLLARYARTFAKGLHVLSFNEISDDRQIEVKGLLG